MTSSSDAVRPGAASPSRLHAWAARFESPTTTYCALVGITAVLVVFGLVMVLSASTVTSLTSSKSATPYSIFLSQLTYAGIGGVALVVASRQKVALWRRLALPVLGAAVLLQILVFVPGIGVSVNGNRNWIRVAGFQMQPSELVKIGLVLAGAVILQAKRHRIRELGHAIVPYVLPVAAISIGLVLYGGDMGTVLILGAIVGAVLFTAGVPGKWFAFSLAGFAALAVTMVVTSPNRLGRFDVWLGGDTNPTGAARQPLHGRYALADGGWFGLGLGGSREKWNWLSAPHNDFIFAVIGEELGVPGTLTVLALFACLALVCYRLVMRSSDFFTRVATAGIMAWILVQAMVNIGVVIGLLPVIGVPLPLVSSGGSSLIMTLLALGILMSFARGEPGCAEALRARPSVLHRTVTVLPRRGRRRGDGGRS